VNGEKQAIGHSFESNVPMAQEIYALAAIEIIAN
jgi:hypothetical protein